MSKETTPTLEHPTDEEIYEFEERNTDESGLRPGLPKFVEDLISAARDRNRLESRLEAFESAALAVTQAASRSVARGMMTVPDFQIAKLRAALEGSHE